MACYTPNQPYDYSDIRSYNRHVVPPPDLRQTDGKKNTITFDNGGPFRAASDKYGDSTFLTELSRCQPLQVEHTMLNWQYQHKLEAQDILPFLYLGPLSVARNSEFIRTQGITMLLAVRDGRAAKLNPKIMNPARFASVDSIETATFDPFNESDMIHRFDSPIKTMIEHLKARTEQRPITKLDNIGGKILVFCEAGDQRSAAVVVLFIMVVFGLSAANAIQVVQARRFGITIRGELDQMLRNCEEILYAEKQVALAFDGVAGGNRDSVVRSQKRTIQQAWDEDDKMDDLFDGNEAYRIGTAPFKDAGFRSTH